MSNRPVSAHVAGSSSRLGRLVVVLALVVVAAGVALRVTGLSRQSYWSDEMFSVTQAHGTVATMWHMGRTEIHPPLFAVCAWIWEHLGHSLRPRWMRLFPALCGVAAVVACWHGLRRTGLTRTQQATMLAATSACGMAVVYSQDMRSYSMLFLAAVGLTAASARIAAPSATGRHTLLVWTLWGMFASATHLFGGLLAGACALLVLVFNRRLPFRQVLGCLVLAELPQLLWMVHGAFTPGFDAGTTWIAAPDAHDLGWLFTSTFSIGHLTMHPDGFPSSSPWALVALGGVGLMALALNLSGRRRVATGQAAHDSGQAPASTSSQESTSSPVSVDEPLHAQRCIAMFLGLLSVLFIAALFVGSHVVHLWTLRNMIVITPALTWGTTLGLLLLAGMPRNQQFVALALLTVSLAQLIGTGHALRSPYKSQLSQAIQRAAELRTQYPAMHVYQARSDYWWLYSSQLPPTNREYQRIMTPYTSTSLGRIGHITPAPAGVPTLYLMYTSPSLSSTRVDQRILANNRPGCHAEAFTQVAFVFCTP